MNTPDTWLKGKKVYFSHKRANISSRRQKELLFGKGKPAKRKSCPRLIESKLLILPGEEVLGEGCSVSRVVPTH